MLASARSPVGTKRRWTRLPLWARKRADGVFLRTQPTRFAGPGGLAICGPRGPCDLRAQGALPEASTHTILFHVCSFSSSTFHASGLRLSGNGTARVLAIGEL